ncbi:MAG: Trk system potassium transporter TrkA [Spirochaetales bacterium]|nr:Trk system potassium transporter TrkA [Spirochaetales bacterium]
MYVIILGAGRVGYILAQQLIDEGKHVALIERDPMKVKDAINSLDCLVINGSGTSLPILKKAGVHKADVFVSVAESDEINMIACSLVRSEFARPITIARVRNIDYSEFRLMDKKILGIDYVINPKIETSKAVILAIKYGARSDVMLFENVRLQMRDLTLGRQSLFINRPLSQVSKELNMEFLVTIVLRDNTYIIPEGDTILREKDTIYILSNEEVFEQIFTIENLGIHEINNILLIGGGTIGTSIADSILELNKDVPNLLRKLKRILRYKKKRLHIIDKDYQRCKYLTRRFPEALVTCQDIMDEGALEDPALLKNDLIITATGNHELNLITGSFAKTLGIHRAIALVIKNSYCQMAQHMNLDVTISRNTIVVNSILKTLRRGNIKNVYTISSGRMEVLEFSLSVNSSLIGKQLKDIRLPKNTLIIFISRGEETLIPHGSMVIEKNDVIALITERESIKKLETLLMSE